MWRGPIVSVDLPISRLIPTAYVDDFATRIGFYRRLSEVKSIDAVDAVVEKLRDRVAPAAAATEHLLHSLRCHAARIDVAQVQHENACVVARLAGGINYSDAHRPLLIPASLQIGRRCSPTTPKAANGSNNCSATPIESHSESAGVCGSTLVPTGDC